MLGYILKLLNLNLALKLFIEKLYLNVVNLLVSRFLNKGTQDIYF